MKTISKERIKSSKTNKRKGFSLVELVVCIVIIGVLAGVSTIAYTKGKDKANNVVIDNAFKAYSTSVIDSYNAEPSIQLSSYDVIESIKLGKESVYSPEKVHSKIVELMNSVLEDKLRLIWNRDTKRYESSTDNPYGGKYILVDMPVDLSNRITGKDFNGKEFQWSIDDIVYQKDNKPIYQFAIISTGKSGGIDDLNLVSKNDRAIVITISEGLVNSELHTKDNPIFTDNFYIPYF